MGKNKYSHSFLLGLGWRYSLVFPSNWTTVVAVASVLCKNIGKDSWFKMIVSDICKKNYFSMQIATLCRPPTIPLFINQYNPPPQCISMNELNSHQSINISFTQIMWNLKISPSRHTSKQPTHKNHDIVCFPVTCDHFRVCIYNTFNNFNHRYFSNSLKRMQKKCNLIFLHSSKLSIYLF